MDPVSLTIIGGAAGVITICTFIGSSLSNWLFSQSNVQTQSEIKNEIRVMSNDIKGIGTLEMITIGIVIFVIAAICGMGITAYVTKKCKRNQAPVEQAQLQNI